MTTHTAADPGPDSQDHGNYGPRGRWWPGLQPTDQQAALRENRGDLGDVAQRRAPLGHVARQVLERRPLVLPVALLGVQLDQLTGLLKGDERDRTRPARRW